MFQYQLLDREWDIRMTLLILRQRISIIVSYYTW